MPRLDAEELLAGERGGEAEAASFSPSSSSTAPTLALPPVSPPASRLLEGEGAGGGEGGAGGEGEAGMTCGEAARTRPF